jgi:hypothetical protein
MAAKLRISNAAPHKRTTAIATSAPTRMLRVRLGFKPGNTKVFRQRVER